MSLIERTIQCTTCRGSGEMESDDSTDDRIYKCWACDGIGKIADRRRPDPQLAGAVTSPSSRGYTVIGPECFAAKDGSVLCWRGVNYIPQPDPQGGQ